MRQWRRWRRCGRLSLAEAAPQRLYLGFDGVDFHLGATVFGSEPPRLLSLSPEGEGIYDFTQSCCGSLQLRNELALAVPGFPGNLKDSGKSLARARSKLLRVEH